MRHVISVERLRESDHRRFRAECSCGWRGTIYPKRKGAEDEMVWHADSLRTGGIATDPEDFPLAVPF